MESGPALAQEANGVSARVRGQGAGVVAVELEHYAVGGR